MNFIRKKRELINITQQQLADMLESDRTTVSKWENGKSFPDITTFVKLSKYFNCTVDDLLKVSI
ncbi:hypothetical protein FACS1894105_09290 [Clostridia bacterium]|nr:hypothetical protein FACS1894105_09290 [Clostridia bacterium]